MYLAIFIELTGAILIMYIPPIQKGLGTRAVAQTHFCLPAFTYFVLIFFFDEARKLYLRKGIDRSIPGKVKYPGWVARNTLW